MRAAGQSPPPPFNPQRPLVEGHLGGPTRGGRSLKLEPLFSTLPTGETPEKKIYRESANQKFKKMYLDLITNLFNSVAEAFFSSSCSSPPFWFRAN